MSDRSIMQPPGNGGQSKWLDAYMPEGGQLSEYGPQTTQPQQFTMAMIRGILFRQRWLIAGVLAAAVIAGVISTLLATPMYQAHSSVRIEPYGNYIVEGQSVDQGISATQVSELMATQIGVITSRNLAQTVAADLNLGERNDFLGPDIDQSRPPNMTDEQWRDVKQERAAAKLQSSVSAEIPNDNWIIEINYVSEDPVIAAEMANAYAAAFAASETRDTISNNEYARNYLSDQIAETRQRLQEAEQAANSYARANGIILQQRSDEEGGASVTLTATNMASINAQVTAAQAARIAAEQRWRSIQNLPVEQLVEFQNNTLLQGLIDQRTAKQNELVQLRQQLLDGHPRVASARQQIETLDAQINRTAADIKSAVRNEYVVARNQEDALRAALGSATGETLAEQDKQGEFSVLEREAQAIRDQLQALLTRFNQISTSTDVQSGMINPLDSAAVPVAPYAPSLLNNIALALVLGVALAGGLAVLREMFDEKIRSFEDVEAKIGIPLLGHTPFVEEEALTVDGTDHFSPLMEAYSSIRSSIDFALPQELNVLQLTSSTAGEGKSTTSLILAELFARLGRRTLLVDCDLRRPSLAKLLNTKRPKVGVVEVLLGEVELQSAVLQGMHQNLEILPVGEVPANPTEILASSRMREFIARVRQEYSLVIFDSSPVLGLADAPMLSQLVDGTVFVMEANRVQFSQVRSSIRRLQANGGNPLGAVLTKYRALEAGDSYSYQYGYYEYGTAK